MLAPGMLSRVSVAGLILVLIAAAVLAVYQDRQTRQASREMAQATDISRAYAEASRASAAQEAAVYRFLTSPSEATIAAAQVADEAFVAALKEIERVGGPGDRELARSVAQQLVEVRVFLDALFEAGLDGHFQFGQPGSNLVELLTAALPPAVVSQFPIEQFDVSEDGLVANPFAALMAAEADRHGALADAQRSQYTAWEHRQTKLKIAFSGVATVLGLTLLYGSIAFGRQAARSAAEVDQMRRDIRSDPLTGLIKRRGFEEELRGAVDQAQATSRPLILAVIDIDRFKETNDTFGHHEGDGILKAVADVVRRVAARASAYRVGGDDFAVLLPDARIEDAYRDLEELRTTIRDEFEGRVTVSIGFSALRPEGDSETLEQEASLALYDAKIRGRNVVAQYQEAHRASTTSAVFSGSKMQAVRRLLVEGNVQAVFQPIWDLRSQSLLGHEALSRPDEKYGLSGPVEMFEIAEKFGRVPALDLLCAREALSAGRALGDNQLLFLNLSPYSIAHHGFSALDIARRITAAGFPPSRVVFEITERSQVAAATIVETVAELRRLGFTIALDDVGAGNNGLEYLRVIAPEFVKVDRDVLIAALQGGAGRSALMAILAFAADLGATVIAEGVEDESSFLKICEIGQISSQSEAPLIHCVQGYLFGRPQPASAQPAGVPTILGQLSL